MFRRLFPVFCLVTIWLGALPAQADINIYIELRPRYNATPVHVTDPECPVNPDKIINIVLSPPGATNTTAPPGNLHLCGVDETVDSERLLAEWNGPYIFTFLNKKDSNVSYSTSVYSLVSSEEIMTTTTPTNITSPTDTAPTTTTIPDSTTEKSNTSTTAMPTDTGNFTESNNTGLYSLFLSPPQHPCDNAALEAAASGEEGFYSIFIGTSKDFSAQKEIFVAELNCLKSYYSGQKPNLCATKLVTDELRGQSRMKTMKNMFNFAFNEERKVSPNQIKQCQSSESTKETIQQCSFFDTTSDVWFARQNQTVLESDGYVKAELLRVPNNKKAVCHVKTSVLESENAATEDDFSEYDGPITFGKDAQSAEVYIGLKVDDIVEGEEAFVMTVETLTPIRNKRSPVKDTDNEHQPPDKEHQPPDNEHQPPDNEHQPPDDKHQPPDNRRQGDDSQKVYVAKDKVDYKCINDELGKWFWHRTTSKAQPEQYIEFFNLEEDPSSQEPHLHWARRCNQEHGGQKPFSEINTLAASQSEWSEEKTDAEKLAKASIKLLDFISHYKKEADKNCPGMSSQTVAMAMIKDKEVDTNQFDIFIAGNLKQPFSEHVNDQVYLEVIETIIREEFPDQRNIFILYPDAKTFGGGSSGSHAEMQLVKYFIAKYNHKEIINIGVSKTPCCNCNTVLKRVKGDMKNEYEAGIYQSRAFLKQEIPGQWVKKTQYRDEHGTRQIRCSHIPEALKNIQVASGPGSDSCQRRNEPHQEYWCGSQWREHWQDETTVPGSWWHPLDKRFGYEGEFVKQLVKSEGVFMLTGQGTGQQGQTQGGQGIGQGNGQQGQTQGRGGTGHGSGQPVKKGPGMK